MGGFVGVMPACAVLGHPIQRDLLGRVLLLVGMLLAAVNPMRSIPVAAMQKEGNE